MLLIVLECAPPRLTGYCSSWALQVATGVYVASLPASAREEIWGEIVQRARPETRALMIWPSGQREQGLEWLAIGETRRTLVDWEGLLVSVWLPAEGGTQPEDEDL